MFISVAFITHFPLQLQETFFQLIFFVFSSAIGKIKKEEKLKERKKNNIREADQINQLDGYFHSNQKTRS
jgi:hypothetical protein